MNPHAPRSLKSIRTPPWGLPAKLTSPCRTLRRTPIAVIQRNGPSIRHEAMFAIGVWNRNRPKWTSSSSFKLDVGRSRGGPSRGG